MDTDTIRLPLDNHHRSALELHAGSSTAALGRENAPQVASAM